MATTLARIKNIRGTAAEFAANPTLVLLAGEIALETDTGRVKFGDGVTQLSALPYFDVTVRQLLTYSTLAEIEAGTVDDQPIAPDQATQAFAHKTAAYGAEAIANNWTHGGTVTFTNTVTSATAPTTDNELARKVDLDGRFTTAATSAGSGDSGKAPILNTNGQIDGSFLSISGTVYQGQFDPVGGSPALENTSGGGTSPGSVNGDFYTVDIPGGGSSADYDFDTATPGSGTTLQQGDIVRFNTSGNTWDVTSNAGVVDDPNAIKTNPTNNGQATIQPAAAISPLQLRRQNSGATSNLLEIQNESGTVLNGFTSDGTLISTGPSKFTYQQSSHGFTSSDVGTPLYLSGSSWTAAIASATTTIAQGFLAQVVDTNNIVVQQSGELESIDSSVNGGAVLVAGTIYYLSAANAGEVTNTAPATITQTCFVGTGNSSAVIIPSLRYQDLNNAALTGAPTAPTPANTSSDTAIATTAFVKGQAQVCQIFAQTEGAELTNNLATVIDSTHVTYAGDSNAANFNSSTSTFTRQTSGTYQITISAIGIYLFNASINIATGGNTGNTFENTLQLKRAGSAYGAERVNRRRYPNTTGQVQRFPPSFGVPYYKESAGAEAFEVELTISNDGGSENVNNFEFSCIALRLGS